MYLVCKTFWKCLIVPNLSVDLCNNYGHQAGESKGDAKVKESHCRWLFIIFRGFVFVLASFVFTRRWRCCLDCHHSSLQKFVFHTENAFLLKLGRCTHLAMMFMKFENLLVENSNMWRYLRSLSLSLAHSKRPLIKHIHPVKLRIKKKFPTCLYTHARSVRSLLFLLF